MAYWSSRFSRQAISSIRSCFVGFIFELNRRWLSMPYPIAMPKTASAATNAKIHVTLTIVYLLDRVNAAVTFKVPGGEMRVQL